MRTLIPKLRTATICVLLCTINSIPTFSQTLRASTHLKERHRIEETINIRFTDMGKTKEHDFREIVIAYLKREICLIPKMRIVSETDKKPDWIVGLKGGIVTNAAVMRYPR